MRRLILGLAALALLLLALAGGWFASPWFAGGRDSDAQPVVIVIEPGDSLSSAARRLEQAGLVSSSRRFTMLARLLGSNEPVRAGEYAFYRGERWGRHLATMQSGRSMQRMVVIPEGMPSAMVHDRLMAAPFLTGTVPVPEEGSVLPDSYSYQRGETRAAVLARMQAAMRRALADLWARRRPGIAVTTPEQAIILASIVEKETGKPSERRMVAGVYTNRLLRGIPLQADPTVIYPVTRGRPLGRRIRRSELAADNGYNTYARIGLPAGPIANPGRAAIAAVLDPERTDALFFVADGTGGHVFADTLEQHNANVERWYAIRRARGEM